MENSTAAFFSFYATGLFELLCVKCFNIPDECIGFCIADGDINPFKGFPDLFGEGAEWFSPIIGV